MNFMSAVNADNKIIMAAQFAAAAHAGQFRRDGITPYISGHVAIVAGRAATHSEATEDFVCAMYLHDTVEDCGVKIPVINYLFGSQVGTYVAELTSYSKQIEFAMLEAGKEYIKPSRAERKEIDRLYLKNVCRLSKIGKLYDRNENLRSTLIEDADPKWALKYVEETTALWQTALSGVDVALETELSNYIDRIRKKYSK